MDLPTSALFVVRRKKGIYVVKDESGFWALPGGMLEESCEDITSFASASLYPLFDNLEVQKLRLVIAPKEKVSLGEDFVRCSVFLCRISGTAKEELLGNRLWLAPVNALVSQAIAPDMRWIIRYIEAKAHSRPA